MQITKAFREVATKATQWVMSFRADQYRGGWLSGYGTDSGIPVDRDRALQSATVAACCNLIGGTIAHLGFDIYKENRSGSIDVATDHQLHELLKWEPNLSQTSDEFWQRALFDVELSGNSVSRISRNRSGVLGLETWAPERVSVKRESSGMVYQFRPEQGKPESVLERGPDGAFQVLHLRNITTDGYSGVSTVQLARQRIGLDLAIEKYASRFFGRGGRVKDIFEFDKTLTEEQRPRFNSLFTENYANGEQSHGALLLEGGVKYKGASGATPNEAQFLEAQVSTAIAICRFFGVPPTLVGILDRATYNNQEQLMLQFLQLCLTPRVSRAEKTLRRALLTPAEKRAGYKIQCKLQKLLRADTNTRSNFYKTLMSLGAISANEIRDLEDMPRIDDPKANEYPRAVNIFGPEEQAAQAGADAGAAAGTQAAQDVTRAAA